VGKEDEGQAEAGLKGAGGYEGRKI
jgi:hypothetical protein